jgi:hypothetical protein
LINYIPVSGPGPLLIFSNYERPHRGYRNMGRRPAETIELGKKRREEPMKEAA